MRWIETPPAGRPAPDRTAQDTDDDVLSAVLDVHRATVATVEDAHRRAAESLEMPAEDHRPAAALRRSSARAHRDRAEAHRRRGSVLAEVAALPSATQGEPGAADLESLTVPDELGDETVHTSAQMLAAALEAAAELPDGEHGLSRPPLQVRVGIIASAPLQATFSGAADVVALTAETWRAQLDSLDLVLVSSDLDLDAGGWRAAAETAAPGAVPRAAQRADQEAAAPISDAAVRRHLAETVLDTLRAREVPAVFFSRHGRRVARTLELARSCRHIVCLDAEAADRYRESCPPAASVDVVPEPVSPLLHTPIGTRPARTELVALLGLDQDGPAPQLEDEHHVPPLLDGLLGSGRPVALMQPAHAADPGGEDWVLPTRYAPWTVSAEEAAAADMTCGLDRLQRGMDVAAAINAVVDSQAVRDPRVMQLQASGTMVVSTYNQGVNSHLPQVTVANSAEDVAKTLETMTLEELRRVQGDGVRAAFTDHHVVDVLARICDLAGLEAGGRIRRTETVLAVADRRTTELEACLQSQTHGAVELVTWAELGQPPAAGGADGERPADIVLPVSADRRYAPTYVADHVAAFRLQQADITAKLDGGAAETDDVAHRHHPGGLAALGGRTSLALSAWWRPTRQQLVSPEALLDSGRGRRVYAVDHLGHHPGPEAPDADPAAVRRPLPDPARGDDLDAAAEEFRSVAEGQALQLAVVVPVHDNGDHLRHKAFASLRRSTIFEQMHILLIDDGSTDPATVETVEELAHTWPNVSAVHHAAGGSGSASRPRNTGLQLASTPYVTYLDPDDEELDDGYWELLERLEEEPEADFALGTMAVWTHRHQVHDYHAWYAEALEHRDGLFRVHPESLAEVNFRPASIEAMVARTDWLQSLRLVQPVGAVGQDTYFFQQMLHSTRAYVPIHRPVYTYYGAVETSTVNVVSPQYFRKYLILERERSRWLREVGLLERYLDERFETFFVTWYLEKFKRVPPHQRQEAATVLRQIAGAYGDYDWSSRAARRFFRDHGGPLDG